MSEKPPVNPNIDEATDNRMRTGLSIYDEAFRDKLMYVFPNVVMAPPEKAFTRSEQAGKVALPMISVYRTSNPVDTSELNHFEVFHGAKASVNSDNTAYKLVAGIPISLNYQIDIWAQYRSYADAIFRELFYYLWVYPNLEVKVPDYAKPEIFALQFSDMDQPTDYESFTDKYTIHRYTLNYEVPRARLFYSKESAKLVRSLKLELIALDYKEEL